MNDLELTTLMQAPGDWSHRGSILQNLGYIAPISQAENVCEYLAPVLRILLFLYTVSPVMRQVIDRYGKNSVFHQQLIDSD